MARLDQLDGKDTTAAAARAQADLRTNLVASSTLNLSAAEVDAYQQLSAYYGRFFAQGDPAAGIAAGTVPETRDRRHPAAFFSGRPGPPP